MLPIFCLTLALFAPPALDGGSNGSSNGVAAPILGISSVPSAIVRETMGDNVLAPFKAGGRYFFVANNTLYVRETITAPARRVLDPGTFTTIAAAPDGNYIAYSVPSSSKGTQIRIRDVKTGRDVSEVVSNGRLFPRSWTRNSKGFAYVRVDPSDGVERVYYHTVGLPSANDIILFSRHDEPDWSYKTQVSDDGQYLVITIFHSIDNNTRIYFIDFGNPGKPNLNAPVVKLIDEFSARNEFIDNANRDLLILTNWKAPSYQIIQANTDEIRASRWAVVIPASAESMVMANTAGQRYLLTTSYTADTVAERVKMITRIYVAPTQKERQAEIRERRDSIQKAGGGGRRGGGRRPPPGSDETANAGRADNRPRPSVTLPGVRVTLKYELEIPPGAEILDMKSNAEDDELFYVIKLPSGEIQAFVYNVDSRKTTPFDMRPPQSSSSASSITPQPGIGPQLTIVPERGTPRFFAHSPTPAG